MADVYMYCACIRDTVHTHVGRYDVIWCQWVLSHLSDGKEGGERITLRHCSSLSLSLPHTLLYFPSTDDLVSFLRSCAQALIPRSGFIVVKENIAMDDEDVFDDNDSSVTR